MSSQPPPLKASSHARPSDNGSHWIIISLFAVVVLLEYSTPPEYVFGYLYIGPILLSSARLTTAVTVKFTLLAAALTILNVWIPGREIVDISTLASRLIAVLALVVTGILGDRNRRNQQLLAQQQAQLQAHEQLTSLREDFASTLTHDLKTPLLGAIETLKAFRQEYLGDVSPAQQKVLKIMIRSHQTSLQLVETLLDVYRNDIEGLKLTLAPIDLVSLGEEVSVTLTALAMSRQVHINFNYGDSDFRKLLWVNGDAFQLRRVFANLLTNAINHSRRGGKIEVVLESQESYQVAKVIDAGAGITPEELPHLFERFYQGYSDRQASGSGLGLYLTRQIIEAHGGTIWAENRFPQGAIFGFRLPALPSRPFPSN